MFSPDTIRFVNALSRLFGWIYFASWSISFYPQPLLNFRRRSTSGVLLDFPVVNVLGFLFYTISTLLLYASPTIRAEYAARNPAAPEPTVRANDVAFAVHAFLITTVTVSMFWQPLWGFQQDRVRKMRRMTVGIAWGSIVGVLVTIGLVLGLGKGDPLGWAWIDVTYAFGYGKLLITVVKYIPQAWENYKRKSTVGWSIGQVLCDFVGGILSVAQLLLDSSLEANWSGVTGNPVKFMLGNVSILFDVIFMVQHYLLYTKRENSDDVERRRLLGEDDHRRD